MSQVLSERNESIQWLRAIAAIEVMVWHSDLAVKGFSGSEIQTSFYAPLGGVGVEIFFIVSGFLMSYITAEKPSASSFLTSRARRIFPLYWAFTLLVIFVYLTNPGWHLGGFALDAPTVLKSLTLWPQNAYPVLPVGWTLEHEIVFYALVALLCWLAGRQGGLPRLLFGVFLSGLGLVGTMLPDVARAYGPVSHCFSPYMFAFGFGWLLHTLPRSPRPAATAAIAAFAALLMAAWATAEGHDLALMQRLTLAGAFAALMLASRRLLAGGGRATRIMAALGEASYSVYLSHWFVLSALGKLAAAAHLPPALDLPARLFACMIAAGVGLSLFVFVERPVNRRLRRSSAASHAEIFRRPIRWPPIARRIPAPAAPVAGDVVFVAEPAGVVTSGSATGEGGSSSPFR